MIRRKRNGLDLFHIVKCIKTTTNGSNGGSSVRSFKFQPESVLRTMRDGLNIGSWLKHMFK